MISPQDKHTSGSYDADALLQAQLQDEATRKYPCSICSKAFMKADHLARHERSHRNQKPFPCPRCNKSFGRHDVLRRHMKLHDQSANTPLPETSDTTVSPGNEEMTSYNATNMMESRHGRSVLLSANSNESNQFVHPQSETMNTWVDSEDLLEMLTSDISNIWPLTLPVMQFQSVPISNTTSDLGILNDQHDTMFDSPGQQAMQQMSTLVENLSHHLTAEIAATGITSSFLDMCIHIFFAKFTPSFPVLHGPTFLPRENSHPLLLNIIALGSLFIGSTDAVPKGEALWRLAHTSVATSWQALMDTKGPRDRHKGVQLILTALLGQTYALLSKNESLRTTCQVFHGLGFYWARTCGLFDIDGENEELIPNIDAPEAEKIERWKAWASVEVQKRAILGHYILDGQISQFSGHSTCVRHTINPLLTPACDAAFAAATVNEWVLEAQKEDFPRRPFQEIFVDFFNPEHPLQYALPMSSFSTQVVLEGFQSLVSDIQNIKGPAVGTPSKSNIAQALMSLYNSKLQFLSASTVEDIEVLVRWHLICLNLATQITPFCNRLCNLLHIPQKLYSGAKFATEDLDLPAWAKSTDGLRSLLHATAIQELVESLPLGRSHAIHLPASIFSVASIYCGRCIARQPLVPLPSPVNWEVAWKTEPRGDSSIDAAGEGGSTAAFIRGEYFQVSGKAVSRNMIYELNSLQILLGSMSLRWGITFEMDAILQHWISAASGEHQ